MFTPTDSGAKCWLDIYHCRAGMAVSGRIRDSGQNVIQSSFKTGSSSSLSYFQIVFLVAFFEKAFIRNI
jgi:hypothetical protein